MYAIRSYYDLLGILLGHHVARRLALAESRDIGVAGVGLEGFLALLRQFVGRNLYARNNFV